MKHIPSAIPAALLADITALLARGNRVILGLAGTPGSGKSTLAEALATAFGDIAIVVPMDGFHLANVELARLARADRKGAPDTFDAAGFVALLARIRAATTETVYAPLFRRDLEEAIAGAIPVQPTHRLIITEGNYLLSTHGAWAGVRPLLDQCWFVDIDAATRVERLVARHVSFGRTPEAARDWVLTSDEANARGIEQSRVRADRLVRWPDV